MTNHIKHSCEQLRSHIDLSVLSDCLIGLEKEALRVNRQGGIAQTVHPSAFGSALTHPFITTDYSEALLELITPPQPSVEASLGFLNDLQAFVCQHLEDEILWTNSMPCVVSGETSIPLARYGSSNLGMMKTVYRRGLGYRYGRAMQVIAGAHFNFSFSDSFWEQYKQFSMPDASLREVKDKYYFSLIRNVLRYGWLIPLLFGTSPAICKSFVKHQKTDLDEFNDNTFYSPYACSLRMGDIGYQNNKENEVGVKANYKSLEDYVSSLRYAINTPCEKYRNIGIKVAGKYRQLNDHILQIENEYYSTARPKQIAQANEKPTTALEKRGVEYVELRSLDINVFEPAGLDAAQCRFLEVFLLYCLLKDSPAIELAEYKAIDQNELLVAHEGRRPGLRLNCHGEQVLLTDWAQQMLQEMQQVAQLFDAAGADDAYQRAVQAQLDVVAAPELLPSARVLAEMRENGEGFYQFAERMSLQHFRHFASQQLPDTVTEALHARTAESITRQNEIEMAAQQDFTEFLHDYFTQA